MSAQVPVSGGLPLGLSSDRVTRGIPARWAETTGWCDRDGLSISSPVLIAGYTTILRRWKDNRPEDITEHPLPDPEELNSKIPESEWEMGMDGKPRKPWALTYVIYLVNMKNGALFTYANSTFGSMLCFQQLEEQIAVMRMLRGENVFPIVNLDKRPMKTAFGMKSRPHLEIIDWRMPGGSMPTVPQSSSPQLTGPATPTTPAATPSTSSSTEKSAVLDNTEPVKPVTVAEYIADELPPWA